MTQSVRQGGGATSIVSVVLGSLIMMGMADDICLGQSAEIGGLRQDFHDCRLVGDNGARLKCYDALVGKLEPPRFHGSLADETAPFVIAVPTVLRYQSDGPVFVMYLKDARGEVVQNLHIGGGGEASYTITKPGTYSLQVSGTDTWRIWVEPERPAPHG